MESMPVWLHYVMRMISPTPHFVAFSQAVLFRGADLSLVSCRLWRCSSLARSIASLR